MSEGYICTHDELALSQKSSVPLIHCLTRGQSFGLLLNAESAFISVIAVLVVFFLLIRKFIRSSEWVHSPMDMYMISLFLADLIQAVGMTMDSKWVHEGKVQVGTYCSVQGALHQLGETGVALSTLAIAIHTFLFVWCRVDGVQRLLPACIVLASIWLFIVLFVVVAIGVHTKDGNFYETPTPYWCWIGSQYTAERIFGQYLWLWLTLLVSVFSYIPLFFWAKGYITVGKKWWRFKVHNPNTILIQDETDDRRRKRRALDMIAYPLVYSILILPLSIVRWIGFSSGEGDGTPSLATFIVINIYALSGAMNAILLFHTRGELFHFRNGGRGQAP